MFHCAVYEERKLNEIFPSIHLTTYILQLTTNMRTFVRSRTSCGFAGRQSVMERPGLDSKTEFLKLKSTCELCSAGGVSRGLPSAWELWSYSGWGRGGQSFGFNSDIFCHNFQPNYLTGYKFRDFIGNFSPVLIN